MKHIPEDAGSDLAVIEMRQVLAGKFAALTHREGEHPTGINGLVVYRHAGPSSCLLPRT